MAKQREGTNIVEFIDPPPPGFAVSRESWAATPAVMRSEILRMFSEMAEGEAIQKDRRAGRKKRSMGGWFELLEAERDGSPAKLARAAELRAALASEEARFKLSGENDELYAMYDEFAKAHGLKLTLPEYLHRNVAIEALIHRGDLVEGLKRIAEMVGLDLHSWAERVLAEPEVA